MPNTQIIRRRIKSVGKTQKITKAMELVAASKMRKSTAAMERSAEFAKHYDIFLQNLADRMDISKHYMLRERKQIKKIAIIVVASDRGLAGSFNLNILRQASQTIANLKEDEATKNAQIEIIAVGRKAREFFQKSGDFPIAAEFKDIGDTVEWSELTPISLLALRAYHRREYDQILLVYAKYKSSILQEPTTIKLLPAAVSESNEEDKKTAEIPYKIEPDPTHVLNQLLPKIVEVKLFQAVIESNAAEHSARMVAMKNATDAADDLIDDLQLTYNGVRQASITAELSEIVSGAAALE